MKEVAEVQLSYKTNVLKKDRLKVLSSRDAARILRSKYNEDTIEMVETFSCLFLNRANEIICYSELSTGGVAGCVVDLKLVFATAIKCLASGIILCHNHPSGQLKASEADKLITKKAKEIGKLLDCEILDHVILTSESYLSMADECLM